MQAKIIIVDGRWWILGTSNHSERAMLLRTIITKFPLQRTARNCISHEPITESTFCCNYLSRRGRRRCRFKPISVMRRHLSAPLRPLIPQWGSRVTAVCKSGPPLTAASCQCATTGGSRATRTGRVLSWDSESRRSHHYHSMSFWFKKQKTKKNTHWPSELN